MSSVLPPKDSPHVYLAVATQEEIQETWHNNSAEWMGPLPLEAYLRREGHLLEQDLTKDGGLTSWILVHQPESNGPRKILCACETIKKRAFVAINGKVEEVTCHGVASVFCPAQQRGKGYAARMIADLSKEIKHWQQEDHRVLFSILYSDIGKIFYTAHGWQPFDSSHIHLKPSADTLPPKTRHISFDEVLELCEADTEAIRTRLSKSPSTEPVVSIIPDAPTILWHQARSDFFARELLGKGVPVKGAIVELPDGRRAWCYWQHNWTKAEACKDNKLYILRLAVPEGTETEQAELIQPLLAAAQVEAAAWDLHCVELWNPSSAAQLAAKRIDADAQQVHRDSNSITSLLWFGDGSWRDVRWVNNERYGWC